MPFDDKKYYSPAQRADIAGISLQIAGSLTQIAKILGQIKAGEQIAVADLDELNERISLVYAQFDELTGWTSNERR